MRFEFKIALKYLLCAKTQTTILIFGVTLGVMIFVFITSLINGLSKYWTVQVLANVPHIILERESPLPSLGTLLKNKYSSSEIHEFRSRRKPYQQHIDDWKRIERIISSHPEVSLVSSTVNGNASIRYNENIRSIFIKGTVSEKIPNIIKEGEIYGNIQLGSSSIIMGYLSAMELGAVIGQPVMVHSEQGITQSLILQGIFKTGINFLDRWYAYTDLKTSQTLFKTTTGVTNIEIQLKNIWDAKRISDEAKEFFQLKSTSWQDSDFGVMEELETQSRAGRVIQIFSLLIIVIGIFSSLILSVYRLKPEIGIMRSFGMTKLFITNIFLIQGLLIGLVGALNGNILGYLFCNLFYHIKSSSGEPLLPLAINEGGYLIASILTIIVSGITALIPARMAANIDPVECIERR